MEELQRFQQEALAAYALGTITGPTSTGGGGSPQPFSTPEELQPINFQIDQSAPQNSGRATTQLVFGSSAAIDVPLVLLKPSPPLPPPVLTLAVITPMVGDSTVNTANTLNASGASTGFAINGTTSGVENGQTVTVTIVNGSNVAVETFAATVTNNAWSVNVSPAQAHALSDGGYTVMASVSNAAGTPAPPASQNLTVDETPPAVTFGTVSFTGTVQGDHVTSNTQVTLSGTVSDNVSVSQVQVFNGSQLLGTATVDNVHHTWTLTTTLASGTYNHFNATAIDEAGNPANASTTQTVQVNNPPVVMDTTGKTGWTEAAGLGANAAVVIDGGVTVTDPDNTTLASAKVTITNFVSGQDVLAFTNTNSTTYGNIAAGYNSATGILSLTSVGATATLAQWQAALDAVTYNNTSHNPTTTDRTITFVVNDGQLDSTTSTKTVSITPTDTLPTVMDTTGKTGWTEAAGLGANAAVVIDGGVTVTDPDNTTLASAKVTITNFVSGQDVLAFTNTNSTTYGNIAAGYNSATGILSLTSVGSTATLAQWQAALDAVTYDNTSHNPTTTDRTITFVVNDGQLDSNIGTKTVSITPTDTLPTVTDTTGKTGWTEAAGLGANAAVVIDGGVTVTDPDNTTLASAKVTITNFVSGQDVLAFTNTNSTTYGNIAAGYDSATGILSLTSVGSTATLAQWQAALDAVTYNNTSHNPTATDRTITFVVNDGQLDSTTSTKTVSITPTDTLPTVMDTTGKTGWTEAAGLGANAAVVIDGGVTVTDPDNTTLASAKVTITNFVSGQDVLAFTNTNSTTYGNIAAGYDSATGILSLTSAGSTATLAQWQAALDAVTYDNTSHNPTATDRTITFVVNDGQLDSNTGTKTVSITAMDTLPTVTDTAGKTGWTEAAGLGANAAVVIDGGVTVTDPDNTTLASAKVTITNFVAGQDVLAFTNTKSTTYGNIAAGYNSATGILSLTSVGSTATLAQWQAALDAVTYNNTSHNPTTTDRTITFVVNDGQARQQHRHQDGEHHGGGYAADGDGHDREDGLDGSGWPRRQCGGGDRQRRHGYRSRQHDAGLGEGHDHELRVRPGRAGIHDTNATTYGNITAGYNSATGILSLTSAGSTATLAQWQAALDAVTYNNTSHNPTTTDRTITFVANDGTLDSNIGTKTVSVTAVNTLPVATITPTTYSATEQTSLSLKNDGLAVSDVDSLGGVEKVTLSVTEGTLTVKAGTSGATVSGSGSKSVTITGTLAQINGLLNTDGTSTVSYIDNTYNPSPSATLTLSINDNGNTGSGGALTGSDTATINITPVVSAATYKTFNGSTQNNLTEIDHGGSVRITLTFSGAVHFSGGNPTLSIADGDEVPPGSDDDVATYNASLSDPTHGVLVFTFTADSDGLTHDLAIIAVNGTIKDANNVNVNTTPFIGVLSNHVHTDNTIVQEHLGLNEPAAPAGVAGEPINLALTDLSGGQSGPVTVTVTGAPSDWSLDQGTNIGRGIWAVQTSDPAALTIRTPANFVGAALLNVTESWTNADGSTGTASVKDNVEAYAAGSPIFALSGDDHLSGAGANDLFAFSQPIGNDIIYNFNAASDKIDLIGFNNVASFSDIQANLTDDANGNAVITFGVGETITLQGVHAASLNANDFVFDQVPVTTNAGSMTISDGATLPLSGTINNTGTIELLSTGDETDLQIIAQGITLTGAGHVVLSDSAENVIGGTSADVTLTNVDNTIDGSGDLGGGQLTLVNDSHGIIAATSAFNQLTIDTGAGSFTNHGVVLSNGAGGLEIKGDLYSDGVLEASAGLLKVDGDVIGGGHALIDGGNMEFVAASDAIVQFSGSIGGTLVLDDVSHFTGSVTGFAYGDTIDLAGIDPANVSVGNSGSLEVHYGPGASDFFSLVGNYDPASFAISSDNKGGADIVWNHQTPVIDTDQFSVAQNPDGTTTISGLHVSDSDPAAPTETFTVAATNDASGSSIATPPTDSGSLTDLNAALNDGVTYNPGSMPPATEKVALTVTDSFGAADTENFIFSEPAAGPNVALQGTAGNDVIFATGHQDILTGGGGGDQFVFAPTSETAAVQHTITDFAAGLDKIDIRQFGNIGSLADLTEAQQGNDTLLTLDSHDSVLLKNVIAANLHASDFIISPHGS